VGLLVSLSMLLYPTVSNWWNSRHQSQGIASYVEASDEMDAATYQEIWDSAVAYNEELAQDGVRWFMSEEQEEKYLQQLDVTGTGIMAYIEIPAIDVTLPIYHGTEESVLQVGAGHIAGSSLPVGGESTHCIISGHRGLMSAVLFTDLDDQAAESNAALVKIGEAGETLESVDDSISGVVTKLLGVTTAVVALGTAAVTTTADFETAMSKVKSLISSSSTDLEGYMLSFNFNKNKKIGLKKLVLGDRILIEAVI